MLRTILISAAFAIQFMPSPGSAGGMTLAHPYPDDSSFDIWARDLAGCVENEIGVFVEVIGGGRLGRSDELAKSVTAGAIDAAILPAATFTDIWPELAQLDTPGVVMNTEAAMRLSGQPSLAFGLEDAGGWERNLGVLGIGWRYSLLTGRDLDLGDLEGRKLSVSSFAQSDFLQAFGASTVRISAAEVFAAMEFGVVDGAVVDAERAMNMAEAGDVVSTAWSEDFTPFVTTHVAVISQVSSEIYGLKGSRPIAEQCSWTARDFTQRSIELARAASERGADTTDRSAFEWRDRISDFSASHPLDPNITSAIEKSGGN